MLLLGCIFPEPPDYRREKTAPFLWAPVPTDRAVLKVKSGKTYNLNVKVDSEDDGEGLEAVLYLNYLVEDAQEPQAGHARLPPGTLHEERRLDLNWYVAPHPADTCARLSLLVSHESNFDAGYMPKNASDVGEVTWWVSINESDETLAKCWRGIEGNQ